ncbi:MAG: hypothetical protein WCL44_12560 [bacterium]
MTNECPQVRKNTSGQLLATVWMIVVLLGVHGHCALGQPPTPPREVQAAPSEFVTLNVDDGNISQVLTAFSRQTGKSMVIGPEVMGKVTVRLKDVRWEDALNMILKPYGYGYYPMGSAIVVCSADKVPSKDSSGLTTGQGQANWPSTTQTRVFALKYLDASDVEDMIKSQLSPAGSISKLVIRSQSWKADSGSWGGGTAGGSTSQGSGASMSGSEGIGRLRRVAEETLLVKGKTLIVSDTPAVLAKVAAILDEVDKRPIQVLIEARFVEVESGLLRDMGVEFGTGIGGAATPGVKGVRNTDGKNVYEMGLQQISGTVRPGNFSSSGSASPTRPFDAGLSIAFQQLTDFQMQVLLHAMQEDSSFNILSSPRILTMNNQDATIIVGTKVPIINSQTTSSGVTAPTVSTSLEYYENVGIQLKVLPQICDGKYINLIIHPSVRELVGTASGKVGNSGESSTSVALTEYPVLSTREAETQVLMETGRTIVIGGLIKDRKTKSTYKVPLLGSIPILGALFRRDTEDNQKIDLLIFLTATIQTPGGSEPVSAAPPAEQAEPLSSSTGADTAAPQVAQEVTVCAMPELSTR